VSGDLSLFGDDEPDAQVGPAPVPTEAPIADWLVDQLREALTASGLTTMEERQRAIEAAAGRPVESLRSLTRAEALRVLSQLHSAVAPQTQSASAWDSRDEDTWIDRL
jgi:hypothetical protein